MGQRTLPDEPLPSAKRDPFIWIRLGLAVASVVAIVLLFRRVDWPSTRAHLGRLGFRAPLVLVPYGLVLLCDSIGWLETFERPPKFLTLWRVRIATEAVMSSLPAGVAVGEPLRALLLRRLFGISMTSATANVVVTKIAVALAQGVFIVCGIAMAISPIGVGSAVFAGRPGLRALGMAAALSFLAIMAGVLFVLARGRIFTRALDVMRGLSGVGARARLARLEIPLAQIDHGMALLGRLPQRRVLFALLLFLVGWLFLAVEDWLILTLLSARVSLPLAISMESIVSVVRIGFFFLPGSLGAQEASYYGLLKLFGLPNAEAIAAAFVIVKRAKEVCWISTGYLVLLFLPGRVRSSREAAALGATGGLDASSEPLAAVEKRPGADVTTGR